MFFVIAFKILEFKKKSHGFFPFYKPQKSFCIFRLLSFQISFSDCFKIKHIPIPCKKMKKSEKTEFIKI